jgi:hypothetical protein
MRRVLVALILAAFAATGCESLPQLWGNHAKAPTTPTAAQTAKVPVVTAEEVNDTNARQAAQALLDEMDRDAQGEPPPAVDQHAKQAEAKRP